MKRIVCLLVLALLTLSLLAGCSTKKTATPYVAPTPKFTPAPMSGKVVDLAGYTFDIKPDFKVNRIVSMMPSNTEILCALGLEDKIVGRDAFSNYPETVTKIPSVGDAFKTDIEKIIALKPDVVFVGNTFNPDTMKKLRDAKLLVVTSEASAITKNAKHTSIFDSIDLIGSVCRKEKEAAALNLKMMQDLEEIFNKNYTRKDKKVYFVLGFGQYGDWTAGPHSFIDELITLAHGYNIVNDYPAADLFLKFSVEKIAASNPELILIDSYTFTNDFYKAPGYKDLTAVKDKKVFVLNADLVSRPGPRIVEALKEMIKAIHGDTPAPTPVKPPQK